MGLPGIPEMIIIFTLMLVLVLPLSLCFSGYLAHSKGRSVVLWLCLTLISLGAAAIILCFLSARNKATD